MHKLAFSLLLVSVLICGSSWSASITPYNNLLWWPNPNSEDGSLMPVFVEGGKLSDYASKAGNPDNVHFFLFTPNNPEEGEEIIVGDSESLARSSWLHGAPLKTLAHGFSSGIGTGYPWNVRGAYLEWNQPMNLILVDWKQLAQPPLYNIAAANTKVVGEKSGQLLAFLLEQNAVSIENIHIQGISLGGHVAGITGSTLTALTGLKAPRISAYDPAMPLFIDADDADRIDPTDADFVDVTHTAGGTLGMVQRRGHVDFYPNGGKVQPGCALDLTGTCSHFRASNLNIESIALEGTRFKSCLCEDWDEFKNGLCPCTETADLGEHCSTSVAHGSYFLKTNKDPPFAIAE